MDNQLPQSVVCNKTGMVGTAVLAVETRLALGLMLELSSIWK